MNGDLYFDGKKFISSKRAAKISGYVNDYIGQLCRDGKLDARMVGRSWYVGLESLIEHKNANLLGTRSRGPKDVKSLIAEVEESEIISSPKIEPEGLPNTVPASLPSANSVADLAEHQIAIRAIKVPQVSYPTFFTPVPSLKPKVLGFEGSTYEASREKKKVQSSFSRKTRAMTAVIGILFAMLGFRFGLSLSPASQQEYAMVWSSISEHLPANVLSGIPHTVGEKILALYTTLRNWISGDKTTVFVMTTPQIQSGVSNTSAPAPAQATGSSEPKQGLVVVPVTPTMNKDAVVAKVKNTFSDEVSVKPTVGDNESGVITPVFKKANGDEYLYVLVPITN